MVLALIWASFLLTASDTLRVCLVIASIGLATFIGAIWEFQDIPLCSVCVRRWTVIEHVCTSASIIGFLWPLIAYTFFEVVHLPLSPFIAIGLLVAFVQMTSTLMLHRYGMPPRRIVQGRLWVRAIHPNALAALDTTAI